MAGSPATSSRASGRRRVTSIASASPLYGRMTPSARMRRAVVPAGCRTGVDGMRDHVGVDAELGQRRAAAIGVHDDSIEPRQEPAPELEP